MKLIQTVLLSLFATLVLMPSLSSCSDDEKFDWNKAEGMLVGQWILSADFEEEDFNDVIMTLNSNHTGSMEEGGEMLGDLTWSYDTPTHILTLTVEDSQSTRCEVMSVSCCQLSLQWPEEDEPTLFERLK